MIRVDLAKLLPFGLLISAHLLVVSPSYGQENASRARPLSTLAEGSWLRGYSVSVGRGSISIQIASMRDPIASWHREQLDGIDISFEQELFGSHPAHLTIGFEGNDLHKEIRLDADGEDLKLTCVAGVEMSLSFRRLISIQFELSQEDYQRLVNAKTLSIKTNGRAFLLNEDHIRALQRFAETGAVTLDSLFK